MTHAPDPHGPYEGRSGMREVTEAEFRAYRRRYPDGNWSIKTPVGESGPERFFVPGEATGRTADKATMTTCRACPYFEVDGMEHLLYCGHPDFERQDAPGYPYAGAIIRWVGGVVPVPDACPLRRSATVNGKDDT